MVEPLHDIMGDLTRENDDGEVTLNRSMSTGELRKAMVYDATDPDDLDDEELATLVDRLLRNFYNVLVTVFDEEERHIGLVDRSETSVAAVTLEHMDSQGYMTVQAGARDYEYQNGEYYQHGYAEFRPRKEE